VWRRKEAFLSKGTASPGETVYLQIVLENEMTAELKQLSIPVKIPKDFGSRLDANTPPRISVLVQDGSRFRDPRDNGRNEIAGLTQLISRINKNMNAETNVLFIQQTLPKTTEKKKEDGDAALSASTSVGKWRDMDRSELEQVPMAENTEFVIGRSPTLDNFIDFSVNFIINVDLSGRPESPKSEHKRRKWFFGIF
jgi:hypothetical protein